jgi:hypothetical protein
MAQKPLRLGAPVTLKGSPFREGIGITGGDVGLIQLAGCV